MNKVYIATVATLDVEVFYHWLDYYSDMVDDFFITLWGDSTEIDFDDIISVMGEFGYLILMIIEILIFLMKILKQKYLTIQLPYILMIGGYLLIVMNL